MITNEWLEKRIQELNSTGERLTQKRALLLRQVSEVEVQLSQVQGRYDEVVELKALADGEGGGNALSTSAQSDTNAAPTTQP